MKKIQILGTGCPKCKTLPVILGGLWLLYTAP